MNTNKSYATLAAAGVLASLLAACASGFSVDDWRDYLWGLPKYEGAGSAEAARVYFLPVRTSRTDKSGTLEFKTSESWQLVIDGARVSASAWQYPDDAAAAKLPAREESPEGAGRYAAWVRQAIPRYVPVAPGSHKIEIHWYRRTSTWDMIPLDPDVVGPQKMKSTEVPTWVYGQVELAPGEVWLLAPQLSYDQQRRGNPYRIAPHAFSLGSTAAGVAALPDPKGETTIAGIKGPRGWRRAVYKASVAIERVID